MSNASFVLPFLAILFLNWSVYKTAKSQIEALQFQIGSLAKSERQQQEMLRRTKEQKAAADITIIICAFLLCFLPTYFVGILRQFVKNVKVSGEVVLVKICVFTASTICNPIIFSILKREFGTGLKKVLRRIGLINRNSIYIFNEVIVTNSV